VANEKTYSGSASPDVDRTEGDNDSNCKHRKKKGAVKKRRRKPKCGNKTETFSPVSNR